MGTRRIVLTGVGKYELETYVWVPDGDEKRAITYLDEAYPGRWKDPVRTSASRNMMHDLEIAEQEESGLSGQLKKLKRRAAKSLKTLEKLERESQRPLR